jgi:hypothetical protein
MGIDWTEINKLGERLTELRQGRRDTECDPDTSDEIEQLHHGLNRLLPKIHAVTHRIKLAYWERESKRSGIMTVYFGDPIHDPNNQVMGRTIGVDLVSSPYSEGGPFEYESDGNPGEWYNYPSPGGPNQFGVYDYFTTPVYSQGIFTGHGLMLQGNYGFPEVWGEFVFLDATGALNRSGNWVGVHYPLA